MVGMPLVRPRRPPPPSARAPDGAPAPAFRLHLQARQGGRAGPACISP